MGGEGRVRYRHLRRTVIAVLATVAFVLLFGLLIRAVLEAAPTRRMAVLWIERMATGYGAELTIDDLHWGILPPGVRLRGVSFRAAGMAADVDFLQVDLGRVWFARRTVELGTVVASGVRLSLDGLPRSSGSARRPLKIRVQHLELNDVTFEGVDLPGGIALDLEGLRAGWVTESSVAQGFAEVAGARVQIGKMEPLDAVIQARFGLSDDGLEFQTYRIKGDGFALRGNGRVAPGGARFEVGGPLDVGWLDGFIRTRGLLSGAAEVAVVLDTSAESLLVAEVSAPHLKAARFHFDEVEGRLELAGRSLHGTLSRARFHDGVIAGEYDLGDFGGRYPHSVRLHGRGVSLKGFLDDLRVDSAGLAAAMDLDVSAVWDGKKFAAGKGYATLLLRGDAPGLPVDGVVNIGLTGDALLRFDAQELAIGGSIARWQGPLTLGTWEPTWAIDVRPAVFDEIIPLVNTWVRSTVLPDELSGTGEVQVNLSGPFKDLVVNARVEAAPVTLAPIELDRLVAEATIGGSRLQIGSARFQIGDGFGEINGGLAWGEAAGKEQLDLRIRGRRIPLSSIASWIDLESWVDSGSVSFTGDLTGPLNLPRGRWAIDLEDLGMAGLEIGNASTSIGLAEARFTCHDLSCDSGLEGELWWDVGAAEIGGILSWPQMSLAILGENISRLTGEVADVRLDFRLPQAGRPTGHLLASSDHARLEVAVEPETVVVTAALDGAAEASASLDRGHDGTLHGNGNLVLNSAGELISLLAPDSGVPLTGSGSAAFQVDWGDEQWPQLTGRLESMDLELEEQPVHLIEPADFVLGPQGFIVPGLQLRARNHDLFVRWTIDADGQLSGNLAGTMDTLLLRFLLPDWEPAGRATAVVEFLGTIDQPLFEGIAEVEKGSFRLPRTRTILSQVTGTVLLSSGDVQLEGVDFRIMGGRGRCSGHIRERDESIVLSLSGIASGIRFEAFPNLNARVSGDWRLFGPVDDLTLSGDLRVDRMSLSTKEDLATMLLGWVGDGSGTASDGGLNLNLHVEAEETIDLRNPFVRLRGSASLDVSGTSNRPSLIGQVEFLEGGEASLLGNRYEIERASLNFSDPETIEPFINLQASTWVQEFQITVRLSGTFDRFVSTATSTPPLSTPEIYSLLGVGHRGSSLGSSAMGLGLASSILSSELTSVLNRRGQMVLPVDQVRVDPFSADSTGNPTARVSVVKQITPAWTVILQSTLSGEREQLVVSRWYLAPGLFIEAAQHEDGTLSFDLKMRRPY
jgi:hypothetical protein